MASIFNCTSAGWFEPSEAIDYNATPEAVGVTGYPPYFDHCSVGEIQKLMRQQGFVDIDIEHFYRANDYFGFFLPAYIIVTLFENFCAMLKLNFLASGFVTSARR